ncbi:MAG: insulinase family protein, partial [Nitrososphaerota archaeon]|nr:insulinase family protein [Nitrososphaerota archaeon]
MSNGLIWQRRVLSNGLRVLYLPKPLANTAQLSVVIEYGSNKEVKSEAGVAHFLEHMLAGGSDERIQKSRIIENYGGRSDFSTDHECTMSSVDVFPEHLPHTAQILSELLFDEFFDEEKFASERQIILRELAEDLDDPIRLLEDLLLKNLFKNHPISRPIGGYKKTLNKLSLHQLKAVHKTAYVPQNMILILTGNLSDNQIQKVLKPFEDNPRQQKITKQFKHPQKIVISPKEVSKDKCGITQTYLNTGTKTVNTQNADAPKLDVISMILSGGYNSRLFIELREKRTLTYDIATPHYNGLDFGYLSISCAVKNVNVKKTQKLIFNELDKLRSEKISEEELERNKKLVLSDILRGIDNPDTCQNILAYMEINF